MAITHGLKEIIPKTIDKVIDLGIRPIDLTTIYDIAQLVTLSIHDNGCGFDIQRLERQGIGLSSMRERIHTLKGYIDIQSEMEKGVKITVQCKQSHIQEGNKPNLTLPPLKGPAD